MGENSKEVRIITLKNRSETTAKLRAGCEDKKGGFVEKILDFSQKYWLRWKEANSI
jgi:hypothetical protein